MNSGLRETSKNGFRSLRDYLLPPLCLACETTVASEGLVCGVCWNQIRHIEAPYCAILGSPFSHEFGQGAQSAQAIAHPPTFDRARSTVLYDDAPRRLVQSFKFSDRTDLGRWLARWMADWTLRTEPSLITPETFVVPVPLHPRRLLTRRFNQSAELARYFAKHTDMRYRPEFLLRTKATKQQVGLGAKERANNVRGAFRVPTEAKPLIKGARILLIDDVYTTGATLEACSRALKRSGAVNLDCLTFARVATSDI